MQDCYNLGWKIAGVVNNNLQRSVLKTYQSERRRVAQDLIAFDHRFSRLFSSRPAKDAADEAGISMEEFKQAFEQNAMFASGLSVDYGPSNIVTKPVEDEGQIDGAETKDPRLVGKQKLAKNLKLGMRFPSFQVLNQADARPWPFQQWLPSDGRWRLVVFAGNLADPPQMARFQKLGQELDSKGSFIRRYTPNGAKIDSLIEVLAIHPAKRTEIELLDLHEIFHPWSDSEGWDYNKVFVDDVSYHEGFGDAYKNYGVDKERGCVVIARPDQYVGYIGELEDVSDMDAYFRGIMVVPKGAGVNGMK